MKIIGCLNMREKDGGQSSVTVGCVYLPVSFLTLALLIICVLNACFFKDLSLLKWLLVVFLISQLCCWKLGILPFSLSDSLI